MFTLIFMILLFSIFGKLLGLSVKAAWGITKVLFTLVLLPVILIALVIGGLIYIAFPILIIVGIAALFGGSKT